MVSEEPSDAPKRMSGGALGGLTGLSMMTCPAQTLLPLRLSTVALFGETALPAMNPEPMPLSVSSSLLTVKPAPPTFRVVLIEVFVAGLEREIVVDELMEAMKVLAGMPAPLIGLPTA